MMDFDDFVASLGDEAQRYTPVQLRQLHIEVHKLAKILIAVQRARKMKTVRRSPEASIDAAYPDRTLVQTITGSDDDRRSSTHEK